MSKPAHFEEANDYPQHLTFVTFQRRPHFSDPKMARRCLESFEKERQRIHLEIYGYVLMPDHAHLLVGPSYWRPGTLVQWMKLCSTFWLKEAKLTEGSPWARGYWDRTIHTGRQMRRALEYIHRNPVRAELTESPDQYLFSSCAYYYDDGPSIVSLTAAPLD